MFKSKNLNFLKKQYNNIYQILRDRERNEKKYVLTTARSGEPSLIIRDPIEGAETFLHSNYNPSREAEKWLIQYESTLSNSEHICLYGLGLGYYLEELINKYPDKKIYIYEPDIDVLAAMVEAREMSKLLSSPNIVALGVGSNKIYADKFIHLLLNKAYESFSYIVAPAYPKVYAEDLKLFESTFSNHIRSHRSSLATYNQFGIEWTKNIFLNLPKFITSTSIYKLQNKFKEVTAIIVGSGPSLQRDIEYLKELKNHALVIAAGSSIQALLKAKIEPHLIVSIDGGEANFKVFNNIDIDNIPLAAGSFLHYKILEHTTGPRLHVPINIDYITAYLLDLFDITPKIFSSTSVTGVAIQLTHLFGCQKVVFMGQDLSFPDDQYYSSGVTHIEDNSLREKIKQAELTVLNVSGGRNKTSSTMLVTLRDIEQIINMFKNNDITFINSSSHGAHIQGTEFLGIDKVLEQISCTEENKKRIENMVADWSSSSYDEDDINKCLRKLRHLLREQKKSEKNIVSLQGDIEHLLKLVHNGDRNRADSTIIQINKKWGKITSSKLFKFVIQLMLQPQISTYMRYVPTIVGEKDILKKGILIHKHLGGLLMQISKILPNIQEYIEKALYDIEFKG